MGKVYTRLRYKQVAISTLFFCISCSYFHIIFLLQVSIVLDMAFRLPFRSLSRVVARGRFVPSASINRFPYATLAEVV